MLALLVPVVLLVSGFAWESSRRRRDATRPLAGRLVPLGGRRVHVTEEGEGAPAVVILHGAGDSSASWIKVREALARRTRVLSFDRAGLGASDPGPAPHPDGSVEELRTLLEAVNVPGPVVLVGHSLGGLVARLFATRYPARVSGLVFVDSTHEQLRDDRKFRGGFAAVGVLLRLMRLTAPFGLPRFAGEVLGLMPMYPERRFYAAQLSPAEYAQWCASVARNVSSPAASAELRAAFPLIDAACAALAASGPGPQFGDLPLEVVSNPGFGEGWTAMQRELSTRSRAGRHRVSDVPGHSVQMPRPELVVDAVLRVLAAARSSGRAA